MRYNYAMFWVDQVAKEIKKRNLSLEWVDDMKTPSGKVHVGALRGVVVHDVAYKALKDIGVNSKYTYVFDNHDPMDGLPVYLPREKFEKYMGMPLYKIPSPEEGYKNYADYYAQDFIKVFNAIGCRPEILWATELYESGNMNDEIRLCLDKAEEIREIYKEMYKRPLANDWFPFQVFCTNCGKVSTTRVTAWDGENVYFTCDVDRLDWAKGCGYEGKATPFSSKGYVAGKLPWKIEWAVKWKVIGITVEGAGKDHMSSGGSHDLASQICEKVINYPVPFPLPYEFFLVGGKKMSSSKGLGSSAADMLEILPPELLRFLMVRTKLNQAINFDPSGNTLPDLFDDYQKTALAYRDKTDEDLARVFELSQVDQKNIKMPPLDARFVTLTSWVQMPNAQDKIKEFGLEEWVRYAKIWVERFAPESARFTLCEKVPERVKDFSDGQKMFIKKICDEIGKDWDAEVFQKEIYNWAKELGLSSREAFSAIYISLLDKDYGPKAAWLVLFNKDFVEKRFNEVLEQKIEKVEESGIEKTFSNNQIFSISNSVSEKFPSISVGIAIINGVSITEKNHDLDKERSEFLKSLDGLTTESLGLEEEIKSYRQIYKETGIDWHSRRPSPEALLRRIALGKGIYSINTCVDAYNLVVMKNRISVGAFDFDHIKFPTVLRFAKPGEKILLLGDEDETEYKDGEIAYFDEKGGYNMDFNYRDAQRTAVTLETKNLYINTEGVYDISPQQVEKTLKEACDIIVKYCGGRIEEFGIVTS